MNRVAAAIVIAIGLTACAGETAPVSDSPSESVAVLPFLRIGQADSADVVSKLESTFRSHIAEIEDGPFVPAERVEQYRGYRRAEAADIRAELSAKCQIEAAVATKGEQIRFTMQVRSDQGITGSHALVYDIGTRAEEAVVAEMTRKIHLEKCTSPE